MNRKIIFTTVLGLVTSHPWRCLRRRMDIDLLKRDQDSFIYGHDDEPDYNEDHTKFDHFSNNFDNFYFENIPPHQQQHSEHDSIKHVIIEENKLSPSTLNV